MPNESANGKGNRRTNRPTIWEIITIGGIIGVGVWVGRIDTLVSSIPEIKNEIREVKNEIQVVKNELEKSKRNFDRIELKINSDIIPTLDGVNKTLKLRSDKIKELELVSSNIQRTQQQLASDIRSLEADVVVLKDAKLGSAPGDPTKKSASGDESGGSIPDFNTIFKMIKSVFPNSDMMSSELQDALKKAETAREATEKFHHLKSFLDYLKKETDKLNADNHPQAQKYQELIIQLEHAIHNDRGGTRTKK